MSQPAAPVGSEATVIRRNEAPTPYPRRSTGKWLALGNLIDDFGRTSRGALGIAMVESILFGIMSLGFQLWALQHPTGWGAAFLPLILHRALTVLTDLMLVFCNIEQTWFGHTAIEAFSVQVFMSRFLRLTDGLGCVIALMLAMFSFVSRQVMAGAGMNYKMICFPLWMAGTVQLGFALGMMVERCVPGFSCLRLETDIPPCRPKWRRLCIILLPRVPGFFLNVLALPLAIKLDDDGAFSWHVVTYIAATLIVVVQAGVYLIAGSAAVQSAIAPPTSFHARPERKSIVACILASSTIVTALLLATVAKAGDELDSPNPDVKKIIIPYAGATAFFVATAWTLLTAAIPMWRTEYARHHGVHTPSTAAEARERPNSVPEPARLRPVPLEPPPRVLIRISHHVYRRPTKEDNLPGLQRTVPTRKVLVVARRSTPRCGSPRVVRPARLAWASPQHAQESHRPPSTRATPLTVSTTCREAEQQTDILSPDSMKLCRVCFSNDADAVLLECGHGGICMECAGKIIHATQWQQQRCPMCRQDVAQVVRIVPPHLQTSIVVPVRTDSDEDVRHESGRVAPAYQVLTPPQQSPLTVQVSTAT